MYLDECGVDSPAALRAGPLYWVAAGGYFAVLWATVAARFPAGVAVVGQSQLMDAPGREPSVSILDWTTGNGTAKYAVLALLTDAAGGIAVGSDRLLPASSSAASQLFAQAFEREGEGNGGGIGVLVVNMAMSRANVTLSGLPAGGDCSALVVDAATGNGPARVQPLKCTGGPVGLQLEAYATAFVRGPGWVRSQHRQ